MKHGIQNFFLILNKFHYNMVWLLQNGQILPYINIEHKFQTTHMFSFNIQQYSIFIVKKLEQMPIAQYHQAFADHTNIMGITDVQFIHNALRTQYRYK